jgi:hypothetical protein
VEAVLLAAVAAREHQVAAAQVAPQVEVVVLAVEVAVLLQMLLLQKAPKH